MVTIWFILNWEEYEYVGRVERREDTFSELEESLVSKEISEENFEKVTKWGCTASLVGDEVVISDSEAFTNRYLTLREENFPPISMYVEAKAKQWSEDLDLIAEWEAQEAQYILDYLAVLAAYPAPE